MMNKKVTLALNLFSILVLCISLFWISGCGCGTGGHCALCAQPGETTAEGHRRHIRNLCINQQNLNADLDRALLFDKPSKATPLRVPPPPVNP